MLFINPGHKTPSMPQLFIKKTSLLQTKALYYIRTLTLYIHTHVCFIKFVLYCVLLCCKVLCVVLYCIVGLFLCRSFIVLAHKVQVLLIVYSTFFIFVMDPTHTCWCKHELFRERAGLTWTGLWSDVDHSLWDLNRLFLCYLSHRTC